MLWTISSTLLSSGIPYRTLVDGLKGFGYASWSTYSSGTSPKLPSMPVAGPELTVNPLGNDAEPPPGDAFVTLTTRTPVAAAEEMEMLTSISVGLFTEIFATEISAPKLALVTPEMNCVPRTVTFTRLPRPALVGDTEVMVGAGFVTVKPPPSVAVPPPGEAFVTDTSLAPADTPVPMAIFA